jgi:diguanylate cyclase (GGDEF)-like protein
MQAIIRVVIACIVWTYIFYFDIKGKSLIDAPLVIISGALLIAVGLFLSIIIWPRSSPPRRFLGMMLDFSTLSSLMYLMEDKGILLFALYLWVTIGNGLRYGLRYLYTAMIISIACFAFVLSNSGYWKEQWGFSVGLLIALVALPIYFSSLLKQLNDQNKELKKLYEQMAKHAIYDSLTNLPNRKHFDDHLAETIASSERDRKTFAILYLDLDGFKTINDALGHGMGDKIIEHTARRLEKCVRKGDFVARVGGDEFTILLRDITSFDVARVAEKTIEALAEPFTIAANDLRVTTSIGVATYPHDGADANALIQNADSAMYDAKRSGKNRYQMCSSKLIQQAG